MVDSPSPASPPAAADPKPGWRKKLALQRHTLRPDLQRRMLPWDEHHAAIANVPPALAYDGSNFEAWRASTRTTMVELLGFDPQTHGPDTFNVQTLWTQKHEMGTIHKLLLTAEGYADQPMYWCLPKGVPGKQPVMICLQGHTTGMHLSIGVQYDNEHEPLEIEGDRDFALQAMRHGVAALCIEQRGFGERRDNAGKGRDDCHNMAVRALMLGRTVVAERVADVHWGIRFLKMQPEVDTSRIGVMGNSGGGTTSFYAAAMLDAVHLAVPSCSFGLLRQTWFLGRGCLCGMVPGILDKLDLPDVLALHAPKPAVIVGGYEDTVVPHDALHEAFDALKKRYAAAGAAPEALSLVMGPGGHRFYAEPAWPEIMKRL